MTCGRWVARSQPLLPGIPTRLFSLHEPGRVTLQGRALRSVLRMRVNVQSDVGRPDGRTSHFKVAHPPQNGRLKLELSLDYAAILCRSSCEGSRSYA